MSPLEQLFHYEIEYQRALRIDAPGTIDSAAPHTSYALQHGYEALLRSVGRVTTADLDVMMHHLLMAGDARDVTRARDSLLRILGL